MNSNVLTKSKFLTGWVIGLAMVIFLGACQKKGTQPPQSSGTEIVHPHLEDSVRIDTSNVHLVSSHAGHKRENDQLLHLSDEAIDSIQGVNHTGKHPGIHEKHPDFKVFGWHLAGGTKYKSYNYSILWGLGYFDYEIDPATGNYANPNAIRRWRTSAAIDSCKAHGTKVYLTVTNFTHSHNKQFLANPAAWQTLIDSMVVLINARQADGISVDFETIFTTRAWSGANYRDENKALSDSLVRFFAEVKQAFDQEGKGWEISIALPASDHSGIFNLPELVKSIDYFMVMGYDYWYAGSPTTGPVSPLHIHEGYGSLSLEQSVFHYLGKDKEGKQVGTGIPPKRLFLALPYYSRAWGAHSDEYHAPTTGKDRHAYPYSLIKRDDYAKGAAIDTFGYAKFKTQKASDGTLSQVWFDDRETLTKKIAFIKEQGLAGMGIWALGDDNGYTDLWEMLVAEFGKPMGGGQ